MLPHYSVVPTDAAILWLATLAAAPNVVVFVIVVIIVPLQGCKKAAARSAHCCVLSGVEPSRVGVGVMQFVAVVRVEQYGYA